MFPIFWVTALYEGTEKYKSMIFHTLKPAPPKEIIYLRLVAFCQPTELSLSPLMMQVGTVGAKTACTKLAHVNKTHCLEQSENFNSRLKDKGCLAVIKTLWLTHFNLSAAVKTQRGENYIFQPFPGSPRGAIPAIVDLGVNK